jgi:predicted nucleic acid-binding protein
LTPDRPGEIVVVGASVLVDIVVGTEYAVAAKARLAGTVMHAPAHLDAEVLSALERLQRAGELTTVDVEAALTALAAVPLTRHAVVELMIGAWSRWADLRLVDALYAELATRLHAPVLTTIRRFADVCPLAESVTPRDQ